MLADWTQLFNIIPLNENPKYTISEYLTYIVFLSYSTLNKIISNNYNYLIKKNNFKTYRYSDWKYFCNHKDKLLIKILGL